MNHPVNPPVVCVIAKCLSQFRGKRQLRLYRIVAMQGIRLGSTAKHPFPQFNQSRAQRIEHCRQRRARRPRLVIIQQCIIEVASIGQRRCLLALQRNNLFQRRQKSGDIFSRARFCPDALRLAGQPRQIGGELGRDFHRPRVRPTDMTQLSAGHIVDRLGGVQPVPHARICASGVQYTLNRSHFGGALIRGPARHHGFLIPAEAAGDL